MRIEPQQGAFFIGSHHSAVTGHVAGQDGRKASFDPLTSHKKHPDLACQVYGPGRGCVYRGDDVRFGSKADMRGAKEHVHFTPKSGHVHRNHRCPLWAKSGRLGLGRRRGFRAASVVAIRVMRLVTRCLSKLRGEIRDFYFAERVQVCNVLQIGRLHPIGAVV